MCAHAAVTGHAIYAASSLRRRHPPHFDGKVVEGELLRRKRHAALLVVELRGEGDQPKEPQAHAEPLSALALRAQQQCMSDGVAVALCQKALRSLARRAPPRRGAPCVQLLRRATHRRQLRRRVVQNRLRVLAAVIPLQLVVLRHLRRAPRVRPLPDRGAAARRGSRGARARPGRVPPETPAGRARPAGQRRRERPQWH